MGATGLSPPPGNLPLAENEKRAKGGGAKKLCLPNLFEFCLTQATIIKIEERSVFGGTSTRVSTEISVSVEYLKIFSRKRKSFPETHFPVAKLPVR